MSLRRPLYGAVAVAALLLLPLVSTDTPSLPSVAYSNATQYIFYNGSISTDVDWSSDFLSSIGNPSCSDSSAGPYPNTFFFLGKNPPWDPNPFFFELWRAPVTNGTNDPFGFATDQVYGLDFASSGLSCFETGGAGKGGADQRCRALSQANLTALNITEYYVPDTALNLNETVLSTLSVNNARGYSLTGNSSTSLFGNGTLQNTINLIASCMSDDNSRGWSWNDYVWNTTKGASASADPFTYEITFTNTTASITITTTPRINVGSMKITFEGTRGVIENFNSSDTANQTAIELVTSSANEPAFQFVDGQQIHFTNQSGTWKIGNDTVPENGTDASGTPTVGTQAPTGTGASGGAASTSSKAAAEGVVIPAGTSWVVLGLSVFGMLF